MLERWQAPVYYTHKRRYVFSECYLIRLVNCLFLYCSFSLVFYCPFCFLVVSVFRFYTCCWFLCCKCSACSYCSCGGFPSFIFGQALVLHLNDALGLAVCMFVHNRVCFSTEYFIVVET